MSTYLSKAKLVAIGFLSITALSSVVNIPSASAEDYNRSYGQDRGRYEDVRGYDGLRGRDYRDDRRDSRSYPGRRNQRLCLDLRQSIAAIESDRTALLRRHRYNPDRLRFIERELRQKRAEYLRACR
jgi:hypothetical protein